MGELPGSSSNLPDALVRLSPDCGEVLEHRALKRPVLISRVEATATRLMQRIHHFPEDIELQLTVRGIADPHRARALVAG